MLLCCYAAMRLLLAGVLRVSDALEPQGGADRKPDHRHLLDSDPRQNLGEQMMSCT
jgi:hypothetical protein